MSQVYFVTSLLIQQRGWDRETRYLQEAMEKRNIKSQRVPFDDPQIKWDKANLSIIRTPHDYWLDVPKFLKWTKQVEKHTTLWNQSKVIQWNSTKKYLIKLQEAKVPVPPTIHVKQGSNNKVEDLIKNTNWDEIIIKPAVSAGAFGAGRYQRDDSEAEKQLENILHNGYSHLNNRDGKLWNFESGDVIIQKFIPEIMTQGEASLIYFGGEFSHSVMKMPAKGEFRIHDVYGGKVLPYKASEEEKMVAEMGLETLGMDTQYARIDTVLTNNGPLIIEMELIEPRLYFEYYPETAESYADYIENYLRK